MKSLNFLKSVYSNFMFRLTTFIVAGLASSAALAIDKTDLTVDKSGGKKFDDIATNIDNTVQTGASLLIQIVSVGGFVVVALSLFQIYKASKDEREKPMSAVVGLFVGGLMAAVGSVMWIMKNTLLG